MEDKKLCKIHRIELVRVDRQGGYWYCKECRRRVYDDEIITQ